MICRMCQREFAPTSNHALYCSFACRGDAAKKRALDKEKGFSDAHNAKMRKRNDAFLALLRAEVRPDCDAVSPSGGAKRPAWA